MAKIGLDIGHGKNTFPPSKGVYKGGKGYAEYDANSRVARVLKQKLESAGHTVIMGQPFNSNDVPLATRTNKYFAEKVDLIISLHSNYSSNMTANGYAAFYWHDDQKAKELSILYVDELKKQGFKLWGGSRPSQPGDWSNFHMCRVPSQRGVPSILVENGFMSNDNDFEWIFGSKKEEFAEKCSTVAFNAIQRFLGLSSSQPTKSKPNNKLYKVQIGAYSKKANADNQAKKAKRAGFDVYQLKEGNLYKVQIGAYSQLENAQKQADKARKAGFDVYIEGAGSSSTSSKPKASFKVEQKVKIKSSAKKYSRANVTIPARVKGKSYTIQQISKDDVLLKEINSWVRKSDLR